MRNSVLLTYYRHRPTDARKHRCRILLAASEPVAYRLVIFIIIINHCIVFAQAVRTFRNMTQLWVQAVFHLKTPAEMAL